MNDITNRADIETLVNSFYKKVLKDEHIKGFFTEVVPLDWNIHIPIMFDFWESQLLSTYSYKGNAMEPHLKLHRKKQLEQSHFDRWLLLWEQTLNEHFEGPIAELALNKAKQIAGLMALKLKTID